MKLVLTSTTIRCRKILELTTFGIPLPEYMSPALKRSFPLLTILLFISIVPACAQHRADLRFFDANWNSVLKKEQAHFYRKITDADSVYHVADYYSDDRLLMEGYFSTVSPVLIHHGKATWYFETGRIYRSGYFRNGKAVGIHKEYHPNGALKSEILYDPTTEFHLTCFDENGNSLLQDGSGTYTTRYMNQDYINEVFDSQLLRAYFVNEKGDTIYGTATRPAQFINGGMTQLQKNISKSVRYPNKHKKNGNDGTVLVSFVIDRAGNMTDVRTVNSLGADFDNIAVRVVRRNRDWKPAQYEGKSVPMRFVVPVAFLHQTVENYRPVYGPHYGSPAFMGY